MDSTTGGGGNCGDCNFAVERPDSVWEERGGGEKEDEEGEGGEEEEDEEKEGRLLRSWQWRIKPETIVENS